MRVGKNVEHFKAAATAADAKGMDPVLKYCAVGRQLGYAIYLSLDIGVFVCAKTRDSHKLATCLKAFANLNFSLIKRAYDPRLVRSGYKGKLIGHG